VLICGGRDFDGQSWGVHRMRSIQYLRAILSNGPPGFPRHKAPKCRFLLLLCVSTRVSVRRTGRQPVPV